MNKMQRGEMAEFEASFTFSCPKFLSPVPPAYDAVNFDDGLHKEPLKLQLKVSELQRRSSKILEESSAKSLLEVGNLYQSSPTLGLEPVSIVHYTRPGSSIKPWILS